MKIKNHFKTDNYYLLNGHTCNEIHALLTDMKKLASAYLSDIEEMDLESERYREAMDIFDFVIQRFLRIEEFDSLQLGGIKSSVTFNELLKTTGLDRAGSRQENKMAINDHPSDYDQFQKHGHPGKYKRVHVINNATGSFTASTYGAGALIVGEA